MEVFFSRLIEFIGIVVGIAASVLMFILPFYIMDLFFENGAEVSMLIIAVLVLGFWISKFIYWLLIEPFLKKNDQ